MTRVRLYMVVDRSPSMWESSGGIRKIDVALDFLEKLLYKLLEKVGDTDEVSVRVTLYYMPGLTKTSPLEHVASRTLLGEFSVRRIVEDARQYLEKRFTTPLVEALRELVDEAREGSGIVVLTDGKVTEAPSMGVVDLIRSTIQRKGIRVVFVAVGNLVPTNLLLLSDRIGAAIVRIDGFTLSSTFMLEKSLDDVMRALEPVLSPRTEREEFSLI